MTIGKHKRNPSMNTSLNKFHFPLYQSAFGNILEAKNTFKQQPIPANASDKEIIKLQQQQLKQFQEENSRLKCQVSCLQYEKDTAQKECQELRHMKQRVDQLQYQMGEYHELLENIECLRSEKERREIDIVDLKCSLAHYQGEADWDKMRIKKVEEERDELKMQLKAHSGKNWQTSVWNGIWSTRRTGGESGKADHCADDSKNQTNTAANDEYSVITNRTSQCGDNGNELYAVGEKDSSDSTLTTVSGPEIMINRMEICETAPRVNKKNSTCDSFVLSYTCHIPTSEDDDNNNTNTKSSLIQHENGCEMPSDKRNSTEQALGNVEETSVISSRNFETVKL